MRSYSASRHFSEHYRQGDLSVLAPRVVPARVLVILSVLSRPKSRLNRYQFNAIAELYIYTVTTKKPIAATITKSARQHGPRCCVVQLTPC